MNNVVRYARDGRTGVITVDFPPVNALSVAVRAGLIEALEAGLADADAKVLVLTTAGRTFIAGADIREFGKPPQPPVLGDVIARFEASPKPVVAALHGTALGGGLELALGCAFRVALPGTRLGLPEVKLGLLPGAGGTQRLPRLAGVPKALEMITSGDPVDAATALENGIIDAVTDAPTALEAGLRFAHQVLAEQRPLRPVRDRDERITGTDPALFAAVRETLGTRARNLFSPFRCVDAVEAACTLPFAEGLKRERALFLECMESPQRAGLIHAFFGEREVAKVPGVPAGTPTRPVRRVAVIGAPDHGIAEAFSKAGIPVTRLDTAGLDTADNAQAMAEADLIVEAMAGDMAVKREIFARLDAVCHPGAILATGTTAVDINTIATATRRPQAVIGLDIPGPAPAVRLLEVVRTAHTAGDVLATVLAVAKRLGKVAVTGNGFVGPAMLRRLERTAMDLVDDGASPQRVKAVLTGFGFSVGLPPLAGLDAMGEERGATPPTEQAILNRCLSALVNEGGRLLEAGVAARPLDIDMIWVHGYGFPAYRGGPMFWADRGARSL